jgi:hypothetical protein
MCSSGFRASIEKNIEQTAFARVHFYDPEIRSRTGPVLKYLGDMLLCRCNLFIIGRYVGIEYHVHGSRTPPTPPTAPDFGGLILVDCSQLK